MEKKNELERNITNLIAEFDIETGIGISSITLHANINTAIGTSEKIVVYYNTEVDMLI